jgi:dienelactone hydrolase
MTLNTGTGHPHAMATAFPQKADTGTRRAARLNAATWSAIVLLPFLLCGSGAFAEDAQQPPERVTFPSADGKTTLVGYIFEPSGDDGSRHPAVVLMHGRSGAYSTNAQGVYNATTLSLRHKAWGHEWAAHGYVALLVDGFGPRGYAKGFGRFTYDDRPAELDETSKRPLDAYGALAYLKSRSDVVPQQIGLMGWSNGGSATLAAMAWDAPGQNSPGGTQAFRAGLAFYPACGLKGRFDEHPFRPYAPVLILHGTGDEEVSSDRCADFAEKSRAAGGNVEIELFEDATHGFDSPTRNRQEVEANRVAFEAATEKALEFFDRYVKGQLATGKHD